LAGHTDRPVNVTVKWDGAPAVFAGIDPTDGKFFVAKKGIFNKDPKVYKTPQDISDDIPNAELAGKMLVALTELAKLGIKGVVQGDMMFTNGSGSKDLKKESIDGEDYITFHPNTIAYAVPAKSEEAKKLLKSKIGVVWHTTYNGNSFESMKASFGVDTGKFRKIPSVWSKNAGLQNVSGTVNLTKAETAEVTRAVSDAGKIFSKVQSGILKDVQTGELNKYINIFVNTFIRRGQAIDPKKAVSEFRKFMEDRFDKEIDKRKSEPGKDKQREIKQREIKFFSRYPMKELEQLFALHQAIVKAKMLLVKKLSNLERMSTFVKTKNGFKVTGHEGFVAIDKLTGGAWKLVDRLEFSANNFSPDIIKGFDLKGSR